MLGYVSRGYYALQLELLLKLYPRNKVLIMDAESLRADATGTCERVFNFMGLGRLRCSNRRRARPWRKI